MKENREDKSQIEKMWLADWDYELNGSVDPRCVALHSNKKYYWKCPVGHPSYLTSPTKKCRGQGCPVCSNRKIIRGINDFESQHPELMDEWFWEENDKRGIKPDAISSKSGIVAAWKCRKCGNAWDSNINNRVRLHSGCPYCANLKVKDGFNDLATKRPALAIEWDYERNGTLLPQSIVAYAACKVWWKCKTCGNSWKATPNQRTKNNCPYCSNHAIKPGFNDFASEYPELVEEWDFDKNISCTPTQVARGSEKKVWWKCKKGHNWKAAINSRTAGRGCPYCSNKKILIGYNDLFTTVPALKAEWDYEKNVSLSPNRVSAGSNRKAWWKCSACGESWNAVISSRAHGRGCPKCAVEKCRVGRLKGMAAKNPLFQRFPQLEKEWDFERNSDIDLELVAASSNQYAWWKCSKGHVYRTRISSRTLHNVGCPYCHNQLVIKGTNDLQTLNPVLAAEWDYEKNNGLTPGDVFAHAGKFVWWKCPVCSYSWKSKINNRANGRGCPNCSPSGTSFIENALYYYVKRNYPDAEHRYKYKNVELDIYLPLRKTALEYDGSYFHSLAGAEQREERKDAFCKENGIRLVRLREIPLNATSTAECLQCDCQDWERLEKTIAMVLNYLGCKGVPDIDIRRDLAQIITSKRKLLKEKSFGKQFPKLLREWDNEKNDPMIPDYFSQGSSVKVWWKCDRGHSWQAKINNRCHGTGCPECKKKWFV